MFLLGSMNRRSRPGPWLCPSCISAATVGGSPFWFPASPAGIPAVCCTASSQSLCHRRAADLCSPCAGLLLPLLTPSSTSWSLCSQCFPISSLPMKLCFGLSLLPLPSGLAMAAASASLVFLFRKVVCIFSGLQLIPNLPGFALIPSCQERMHAGCIWPPCLLGLVGT